MKSKTKVRKNKTPKKASHKAFSTWLKSVRTRYGLSQDAVCAALKITKPSYSRWETGVGLPHADKIQALAKWGKISAEHILKLLASA